MERILTDEIKTDLVMIYGLGYGTSIIASSADPGDRDELRNRGEALVTAGYAYWLADSNIALTPKTVEAIESDGLVDLVTIEQNRELRKSCVKKFKSGPLLIDGTSWIPIYEGSGLETVVARTVSDVVHDWLKHRLM